MSASAAIVTIQYIIRTLDMSQKVVEIYIEAHLNNTLSFVVAIFIGTLHKNDCKHTGSRFFDIISILYIDILIKIPYWVKKIAISVV